MPERYASCRRRVQGSGCDACYNPDVSPLHIATDALDAVNLDVDVDGVLAPAHET